MNHEPVIDYGRRIGAHFTGANGVKNRRSKVARGVEQFGITLPRDLALAMWMRNTASLFLMCLIKSLLGLHSGL